MVALPGGQKWWFCVDESVYFIKNIVFVREGSTFGKASAFIKSCLNKNMTFRVHGTRYVLSIPPPICPFEGGVVTPRCIAVMHHWGV